MQTVLTSREFNQDTAGAKRAAAEGPVFVTDRGRTTHVLLTTEAYARLTQAQPGIGALLDWPGAAEVELPETRRGERGRAADLG